MNAIPTTIPTPRLASDIERENERLRALLLQGVQAISLGDLAQRRWLDAVAQEFGAGR